MDETYIKVAGKDRYLYRAVDKFGDTVDFLLTKRRMKGSAQKFFNKAIANNQNPRIINNDELVPISLLLVRLIEIISGIKTSKLGGVNTLIIVLNKTTETSREELLLTLVSKSLNPPRRHRRELISQYY